MSKRWIDRRLFAPLPVVTPEERAKMEKAREAGRVAQAAAYPTITAENARAALDLFEQAYREELSR